MPDWDVGHLTAWKGRLYVSRRPVDPSLAKRKSCIQAAIVASHAFLEGLELGHPIAKLCVCRGENTQSYLVEAVVLVFRLRMSLPGVPRD
jgi:hypothetical protein